MRPNECDTFFFKSILYFDIMHLKQCFRVISDIKTISLYRCVSHIKWVQLHHIFEGFISEIDIAFYFLNYRPFWC